MSDDSTSKESAIRRNIDKIKVSSAEIVVHGTKEKPCYEIEYFDLSDNEIHIGFGSYKLDIVFGYLEEYFEIVNDPESYPVGDLISREATYKAFSNYLKRSILGEISSRTELSVGEISSIIKSIPTAFDKERVIEKLKNKAEASRKYWSEFDDEDAFGEMNAYTRATEIIEKGGIE